MARKSRETKENGTYHAYSRCADRKPLLRDRNFKLLFLQVIKQTQNKYKFELINYVVMDNHFHLKIKTIKGEASISRIMQYIKARIAERYNKETERTGPFWNERFKSTIIELAENVKEYFLNLIKKFANNPVRSGYVKDAREYEFSAINAYLQKNYKPPYKIKITLHKIFKQLGNNFEERVTALRKEISI